MYIRCLGCDALKINRSSRFKTRKFALQVKIYDKLYYYRNDGIETLKIVDFGLSALIKDEPLSMRCGSPGYVAPEILNDLGYGCKADIFSAGIILYILYSLKSLITQ